MTIRLSDSYDQVTKIICIQSILIMHSLSTMTSAVIHQCAVHYRQSKNINTYLNSTKRLRANRCKRLMSALFICTAHMSALRWQRLFDAIILLSAMTCDHCTSLSPASSFSKTLFPTLCLLQHSKSDLALQFAATTVERTSSRSDSVYCRKDIDTAT
ncbi:unnamed protein product [Albugo candida]|uniref:Uncharacterized protein n=1 Tax=Albugo candida TaxID=65357 RepID=A0A024GHC0_9STRA|nr:unnamed protein product [Albugo candida]|eukprot:CCI46095.1 unnamed protein product [Albugo candida]